MPENQVFGRAGGGYYESEREKDGMQSEKGRKR